MLHHFLAFFFLNLSKEFSYIFRCFKKMAYCSKFEIEDKDVYIENFDFQETEKII